MHDPLSCLAYTAHILSQQQQEQQQQQQQQASSQQHRHQQPVQRFQHHHSLGTNPNSQPNASLSDPQPVDVMTADADSDYEYEYGYGSGVMEDRSTDNEAAAAAAAMGTATGARRGTTAGTSTHYRRQASCDRTASAGGRGAPPSTPIGSGGGSGGHGEQERERGRERERAGRRAASPSADAEERSYGGGGGSSKRPAGRRPVQFWGPFNDWWRSEFERTGKRPGADLVGEWYAAHAASCWGREAPSLEETRTHAKCLRSVGSIREYFRSYRARKKARLEDGPSPAAAAATHGGGRSYSTMGPDPAVAAVATGLPRGSAGGVGAHGGLQNLAALSCLLPQLSQLNALGLSPLQVVAAAAAAANNNTKAGASGLPAAAAGPSPSLALGFHDIDALAAAAASAGSLLGPPADLPADAGPDCGSSGGLLGLPYGIAADPSSPPLTLLPPLQPDLAARGGVGALVGGGGINGSVPLLALPAPVTATAAPLPLRPASTVTTGDGPSPRSEDAAAAAAGSHAVQRPAVVTFTNAAAATSATATSRGTDCEASVGGAGAGDRFCRTSSHGGCVDAAADDVAPAQSAKGAGAFAAPTLLPEAKREEAFSFRVASAFASGCGSGSDGGKSCGSTPPPLSQPAFGPCGGHNANAANLPQQLLESMPYLDAAAVVQVTPRASAPAASGGLPPQRHHSLSQQQQQQPQQQVQAQRRQPSCPTPSPAANGADGGASAPAFTTYGSGPVGAAGSPRRLSAGYRPSSGANANTSPGPGCTTDDEHSLSLSQRAGRSATQQHEEEVHLQLPFHREHRHRLQQEDAHAAAPSPPLMPEHSLAWSSSPSDYGKYEYGKYGPPPPGHQLQQPHPGGVDRGQNPGASLTAARGFPPGLPPHHLHHAYPFGHHHPQQHQLVSLPSGSVRVLPRSSPSSSQQQQPPRYGSYHQPHTHTHTHTQHSPPPQQQLRDAGPRQQAPQQPQQLQGPPHLQAPGSSKKVAPCGPNDTQHSTAPAASNVAPSAAAAAGSASAAAAAATAALITATASGPAGAATAGTVPSLRSLLARPDNELCGLLHELPHDQLVLLLLRAVALVRQKKAHEERLMDELAQVLEQQGNLQAQLHVQRMENAKMYRAIMAIRDERSSGGVDANAADADATAAAAGVGFTGSAAPPPPPPPAAAPPRLPLSSDEVGELMNHGGVGVTSIVRGGSAAATAHGDDPSHGELAAGTGVSPAAAGMATPAAPTVAAAAAAAAAAAVMRNSGRDRATWPATGHHHRGGGVAGAAAAALPAVSAMGAGGGGGAEAVEGVHESCGRLGGAAFEQHDEPHHSGYSGQSLAHPTDVASQDTGALQGKGKGKGTASPGATVAAAAAGAMTSVPCSLTAHSPAVGGAKCGGGGFGFGAGGGGGGGFVSCAESVHGAVLQPPPSGKPAAVAFSDGGSGTSSAF